MSLPPPGNVVMYCKCANGEFNEKDIDWRRSGGPCRRRGRALRALEILFRRTQSEANGMSGSGCSIVHLQQGVSTAEACGESAWRPGATSESGALKVEQRHIAAGREEVNVPRLAQNERRYGSVSGVARALGAQAIIRLERGWLYPE